MDRVTACEFNMNELRTEWPKPGEGDSKWVNVENKKNGKRATGTKGQSFAELIKHKPKGSVYVVGDSLVRGMGRRLEENCHIFTAVSKGGARVSEIEIDVGKMKDDENRHLVVMVGTNDLKKSRSEELIGKYEKLMERCRSVKNRKVTLVGIPKRFDVSSME